MLARRLASLLVLLTACGPDGRADSSATATTTLTSASSTAVDSSGDLPTTDPSSTGGATTSTSTSTSTTGTSTSTGTSTDVSTGDVGTTEAVASTGPGPKLDLPVFEPIPVKEIPGLLSITFYESTSGIMEYTFTVDGPELNNLLADPLSMANRDIQGTSVEFYDVYYSDVDGVFDPNGSYLTIAGSFGAKLPAGGGLNLAEISLNYDNDVVEYGSFLASFVGLGDNYAPGSEVNAIDGDLMTHTTMGNTVDTPDQRLRVTLGFKSSLMPG